MDSETFRQLYDVYAPAVAFVSVVDKNGDESIGTAFHIGDGIFVTARHVVENHKIVRIATTEYGRRYVDEQSESGDTRTRVEYTHSPGEGRLIGTPLFYPDENVDVAALRVEGIDAPAIPLGDHLDDWLGTELVLRKVVVLNYPPIPFSRTPTLIASRAEVNAIVDKYTGGHPHFILSAMARGGFSGGPALTDYGCSLGVITEAIGRDNQPVELGYLAVLSVEPIYNCLAHHEIVPSEIDRVWDGFWNTKSAYFTNPKSPLGFQHVSVEIYRGVLGLSLTVFCADRALLESAITKATTPFGRDLFNTEEIHDKMIKITFEPSCTSYEEVFRAYQDIKAHFLASGLRLDSAQEAPNKANSANAKGTRG
jgi:hypothetical protein